MMKNLAICWSKEFKFYFQSKMIYLSVLVYASISATLALYGADFYNVTTINMLQFFLYQPGVLATIVPVLTMRLWADEYKNNTLEVLLSQPISVAEIVGGKFLAAWSVAGIMILSSVGVWLVVSFMVDLDNKWIAINYLITFLGAGSLCALASAVAAFCYNTIAAFLGAMALCMFMVLANFSSWIDELLPNNVMLGNLAKSFDFKWLFDNLIAGQISVAGILYFVIVIAAALWTSLIAVEYKRR